MTVMNDRRTEILDVAARLIRSQGFRQTSVDDVIREAGLCGKAHFYHYFDSKEALGLAVVERQLERFTQEGLSILRSPLGEPLERVSRFLHAIVRAHVDSGFEGGCPFGNLATEMADANEGFRVRLRAVFDRWAEQLESLLWEVRPRLVPGADTARLSMMVIAVVEGMLIVGRVKREAAVVEGIASELERYLASQLQEREYEPATVGLSVGATPATPADARGTDALAVPEGLEREHV